MLSPPRESVGCPAEASLHHPLVQVSVSVCQSVLKVYFGLLCCISLIYESFVSNYNQQMARRAVSCPPLDLGSLLARLQQVQLAFEDDG